MPIASQMAIPPPRDFSEFEDLCCDLWKRIWQDPTAQRNGRRGQGQHGVDVFGRAEGRPEGLQCKTKDELTGSKLAIGEIKGVAAEAEKFEPSLSCFTIATTALRDATLQKEVRELSASRQAQGKFPVTVQFWDDIRNELGRHEDLLRKYYPHIFAPTDSPPVRVALRNEIEDYCSSLLVELERNLDPWIDLPVTKGGESVSVDEIRACMRRGECFVLIGPSGAGKSHMVKHLARDAICGGSVLILASAKHFEGRFHRLLDEAVSHLTPCSAAELLRGCQDQDILVAVVVDGLNEVEQNAKGSIINGLLAVARRHPCVYLGVTTREETEELHRLNAPLFRVALPGQRQRQRLSTIYNLAPEVLERWSAVLRSPLDFKLAGDVAGASASAPLNEYGFLYSYLHKKLHEISEAGFSFLSRLSALMAERLTWALLRTEVLCMARATASGESLASQLIDHAVLTESPRYISSGTSVSSTFSSPRNSWMVVAVSRNWQLRSHDLGTGTLFPWC